MLPPAREDPSMIIPNHTPRKGFACRDTAHEQAPAVSVLHAGRRVPVSAGGLFTASRSGLAEHRMPSERTS